MLGYIIQSFYRLATAHSFRRFGSWFLFNASYMIYELWTSLEQVYNNIFQIFSVAGLVFMVCLYYFSSFQNWSEVRTMIFVVFLVHLFFLQIQPYLFFGCVHCKYFTVLIIWKKRNFLTTIIHHHLSSCW